MKERPQFAYIGRSTRLEGGIFRPAPIFTGKTSKEIVLATNIRDLAIAKTIMTLPGVHATIDLGNPIDGLHRVMIHEGIIEAKKIDLYRLPGESFERIPEISAPWTWISYNAVRPTGYERIELRDYMHLVIRPSAEERANTYRELDQQATRQNLGE